MSEYGRVLEQRDGYLYDCGRYLYAFLPFLQYVDWQAAPVGPEGACECGGKHPTDEFDTIRTIKAVNPETTVEVLIPDFQGRLELVDKVVAAAPEIISHNMETVRRISPEVRSAAKYEVSLSVLARIAAQGVVAKTGIMVGLGETVEEVCELMDDVRAAGVSVLTIGQYLQPSRKNIPVKEYVTPEQFESYKSIALQKGFKKVESAPLVRSSYHAEKHV